MMHGSMDTNCLGLKILYYYYIIIIIFKILFYKNIKDLGFDDIFQ